MDEIVNADGGGGRYEGDSLVVSGTAGQFDAGLLTGEGYSLGRLSSWQELL